MAETFRYALVLVVDENDLAALCSMNAFPCGLMPLNITEFGPVTVTSANWTASPVTICPVDGPGMRMADASLELCWYMFPQGMTRDQVVAAMTGGDLAAMTANCRHFATYSISSSTPA